MDLHRSGSGALEIDQSHIQRKLSSARSWSYGCGCVQSALQTGGRRAVEILKLESPFIQGNEWSVNYRAEEYPSLERMIIGAQETVTQVCLHLTVNFFKESDALWPASETLVSLTTPLFPCLFFLQSGPVVDPPDRKLYWLKEEPQPAWHDFR